MHGRRGVQDDAGTCSVVRARGTVGCVRWGGTAHTSASNATPRACGASPQPPGCARAAAGVRWDGEQAQGRSRGGGPAFARPPEAALACPLCTLSAAPPCPAGFARARRPTPRCLSSTTAGSSSRRRAGRSSRSSWPQSGEARRPRGLGGGGGMAAALRRQWGGVRAPHAGCRRARPTWWWPTLAAARGASPPSSSRCAGVGKGTERSFCCWRARELVSRRVGMCASPVLACGGRRRAEGALVRPGVGGAARGGVQHGVGAAAGGQRGRGGLQPGAHGHRLRALPAGGHARAEAQGMAVDRRGDAPLAQGGGGACAGGGRLQWQKW